MDRHFTHGVQHVTGQFENIDINGGMGIFDLLSGDYRGLHHVKLVAHCQFVSPEPGYVCLQANYNPLYF